ncbi:MAG: type II toxin-antitoxin system VapC family toxin [Patescibacteria group bacterium]
MAKKKKTKKHSKEKPEILLDSSWILAYMNEKDFNHNAAISSCGAILPYKPIFYIPSLVYLEVFSNLRRRKIPVKKCEKTLRDFWVKIDNRHQKSGPNKEGIIERYRIFSRVKISLLRPNDFLIATEGMRLGAKILTLDLEMYKKVYKYYKYIYYLADHSKNKESDLPRLISDILNIKN